MPVYNCQGTVAKAINSLLSQNYKDKEIIVIDDGSTDYTVRICKSFKGQIEFIDRANRAGAAKCRNIGTEIAQGDIIAVCDADYYYPYRGDAIAKFFNKYKKKHVFYSGLHIQDAKQSGMVEQGAYEWDFTSKCPIPHATVAYRWQVALTCPYSEESVDTDLYEFMLLDARNKGYEFGGCQEPLMLKTERTTARNVEEARKLKAAKYKEYGIV